MRDALSSMMPRGGSYAAPRWWEWLALLLQAAWLALLPAAAAADCSTWRSPQKVWLNEYYFGVPSAGNPPHYLEAYSSNNAFPASWQGWSIEVFSARNVKTTHPLNDTTATACTSGNKTWLLSMAPGGLPYPALVVLKDNLGAYVDAFVFDTAAPPAPWPGVPASNWDPALAGSCPALATALDTQAGLAATTPQQNNMLILQNFSNRDINRTPDGGPIWTASSGTGAGTSYSQCASSNVNFHKGVDNATPPPGGTVTFVLGLTNTGTSALSGVGIIDHLPPVLAYLSATPSNPADPAVTTGTYSTTNPNTGQPATATTVTWAPAAVAAGSTSTLAIKMQVPANATTGHVFTNTAQTTTGLTPSQNDYATITIGSPTDRSFAISVSPASATTCTPPLLGPRITITAMSGAGGTGDPLTNYSGTAILSASSPSRRWYDSAGVELSGSSVTFVNGTASLYVADSVAETITVSAVDATTFAPSVMWGTSGNITFSGQAFGITLTDADGLVPVYGAVAGRPHALRAVVSNCGTAASTLSGTYGGSAYYVAGLNHPAGADAPGLNTGALACPGGVTLPASSAGTPVSLAFTAGQANLALCTTDVGQYAIDLRINGIPTGQGGQTTTVTGRSANFTARPFVVTAAGFPAGPLAAGSPFSGTLTAWRWTAAADGESPRGNGFPDAGATPATIAAAAPGVTARFSGTANAAGVAGVAAAGSGTLGVLAPALVVLAGGGATAQFTYSEAGGIRFAGADAGRLYAATNYLGAAGLHVPLLGDTLRFVPHHFETAVTAGCSSGTPPFSYSGQPFIVTVVARNAAGGTTANYAAAPGAAQTVTLSNAGSTAGFANNTLLPADFLSGVGTKWGGAATPVPYVSYTLPTPPTLPAPATIVLRATDTDMVSSSGAGEGAALIRHGRLRLANAFGTNKADLALPVQAQYWSGLSWVPNSADSCTTLPAASFHLSGAPAGTAAAGAVALAGGNGALVLTKPSPAAAASVDVAINLGSGGSDQSCLSSHGGSPAAMPWLRGQYGSRYPDGTPCPSTGRDPSARATFGIYAPETQKTIDVREHY